MERDQASKFINDLLRLMLSRTGSDLFLTADFPPAIKVDGSVVKVSPQPLNASHTLALARAIMNDKQAAEFERTKECNFAISPPAIGRFRVSAFIQQGKVDRNEMKEMLIHSIKSDEAMCALSVSSKYNADWDFLCGLRDNGRREVETWLSENYRNIGERSSIDIRKEFL